jgi:PAS domain S-box-containing protein
MRAIVNTVADAIVTIDGEGTVETLNPVAARIFGYSPEEVIGQNVKMLMPEDYARMHDGHFANSVATGQAGMVGAGLELSGRRKDGSNFPMELAVSEMMVGGRRMFTGVVRDITERKKAEARQRLLIAELDHRVKNTLAQVSVVAASTRRESSSIDGYLQELDGRIQSMAAAHRLLSESGWEDVGLDNLVRSQLAPYALDANMEIRGKNVALKAAEIQAVAMVLHELVTNAAKYGSLSVPDGRVVVAWDLKPNNAKTILSIDWRELGGPPVVANGKPGYGTSLIRDLIPHELGGAVDLVFSAEGLSCRIEFPFEWPSAPGAFASLAVKA